MAAWFWFAPLLAGQLAAASLDPCRDNNLILPGTITCATALRAGFCNLLGPICPVVCGLCEVFAPPPNCTQAEVFEQKTRALHVLQDMGLCETFNCSVPEPHQYTHADTRYVEKGLNFMRRTRITYGYSSPDPGDPCAYPSVYCNRCGQVVSMDFGEDLVDFPGNLTSSIFGLSAIHTLAINRGEGPFERYFELPVGWASLPDLNLLAMDGTFTGSTLDLRGNTRMKLLRFNFNPWYGDLRKMLVSPALSIFGIDNVGYGHVEGEMYETLCSSSLSIISVQGVNLSGTVPACFGQLPLTFVGLYGPSPALHGDLAPLLQMDSLLILLLTDLGFNSSFPEELSNRTTLTALRVPGNRLRGTLPDLSRLVNLEELDVSNNLLTGASALGDAGIAGTGLNINFQGNAMSTLPSHWWSLPGVVSLDLSNNELSDWPAAGLHDRRFIGPNGALLCPVPFLSDRFDWPLLEIIDLSNNPLHGVDVRSVLGSLSSLPRARVVRANSCGLAENIPRESADGQMLVHHDRRQCGITDVIFPFKRLSTLEVRGNFISSIDGSPWPDLQQADFRDNNLSFVYPEWFVDGAPLFQDFRQNPNLRLDFAPPNPCAQVSGLQADPAAFIPVPGENFSCTAPCSTGSFILRVDASVDAEALCYCNPGYYGVGKTCFEAGPNEWAPGATQLPSPCHPFSSTLGQTRSATEAACLCDAGFYRRVNGSISSCAHCPANTFRAEPGAGLAEQCLPCKLGTFSEVGSTACTECPPGSVGDAARGAGCKECELGRYVGEDGEECFFCPIGNYSDSLGSSACHACPAGRTTWSWSEQRGEYILLTGATSLQTCGCDRDFLPDGDFCTRCGSGETEGLRCPGGLTDAVVTLEPGYYSAATLSVYSCYGDELRCPGGKPGESCAAGRIGIGCALCEDGKVATGGGECSKCRAISTVVLPFVIVLALAAAVGLYVVVDRTQRATQSSAALAGGIALSLLVAVVQQLGAVYVMNVEWVEPVASVLEAIRVINFDLEALSLNCVASVRPLSLFVGKVCIILIALLTMVLIHCGSVVLFHGGQWRKRMPTLTGVIGAVSTVFYMSVVSAITGPLQCQDHPNSKWTSRVYRTTTCWDSAEHAAMVAISSLALMVPLGYLVWIAWVVNAYPRRVAMADVRFLKAYDFLFFRFKPEGYWFMLVFITRSLLFGITPVFPMAELTILVMCLAVLVTGLLVVRILPWRFPPATAIELGFAIIMILLLIAGAFFSPEMTESRKHVIAWFCMLLILVSLLAVPIIVLYWLLLGCWKRRDRRFKYFLTHHKAGAGALARLLKLALVEKIQLSVRASWYKAFDRVFLDSDNLRNLNLLFEHVKEETALLVVLASRDIWGRPWCIGEVTIASLWKVPRKLLRLPNYVPLTPERVEHRLRRVDCRELTEQGLTQAMIEDALQKIGEIPSVQLPDFLSAQVVKEATDWMMHSGHSFGSSANITATASAASLSLSGPASLGSDLAICVDCSNLEALATAMVLGKMLSVALIKEGVNKVPLVLPPGVMHSHVKTALIMCSNGCFEAEAFLISLHEMALRPLPAVPVLAEEAFRVPSLMQLEEEVGKVGLGEVVDYIMAMFKDIATGFYANQASDMVLKLATAAICERTLHPGSSRQQYHQSHQSTMQAEFSGSVPPENSGTPSQMAAVLSPSIERAKSELQGDKNLAEAPPSETPSEILWSIVDV